MQKKILMTTLSCRHQRRRRAMNNGKRCFVVYIFTFPVSDESLKRKPQNSWLQHEWCSFWTGDQDAPWLLIISSKIHLSASPEHVLASAAIADRLAMFASTFILLNLYMNIAKITSKLIQLFFLGQQVRSPHCRLIFTCRSCAMRSYAVAFGQTRTRTWLSVTP